MPAFTIAASDFALLCEVLSYVARSSGLSREDAEDFVQHVHLRLLERNYAPLKLFAGQSSLRTFLTVVVKRQLLDWRNSRYGKWRPSAVARRLGPAAVDLDRLISRDGHSKDEAIAVIRNNRTSLAITALREIAAQLPHRSRFQTVVPEDIEALSVEAFEDPVERAELREAQHQALCRLRIACGRLPERDRRLLYLRYGQRLPVPAIATLLDMPAKRLYRHLDALLASLRQSVSGGQRSPRSGGQTNVNDSATVH